MRNHLSIINVDVCAIFKSDFNIICALGFPQPFLSARWRTFCPLYLLTTDSISVPSPVFLSGGLPIRSSAGFPSRNLENNLYTKACDTFSMFKWYSSSTLVLLSLKYREVSFGSQNKTVLLSAAPPLRKTSLFFHRSSSTLHVLIVCPQSVNNAIALKLCDNTRDSITFPPIWMINGYHFQFQYNLLSKMKYTFFISFTFCVRRWCVPYRDRMTINMILFYFGCH